MMTPRREAGVIATRCAEYLRARGWTVAEPGEPDPREVVCDCGATITPEVGARCGDCVIAYQQAGGGNAT